MKYVLCVLLIVTSYPGCWRSATGDSKETDFESVSSADSDGDPDTVADTDGNTDTDAKGDSEADTDADTDEDANSDADTGDSRDSEIPVECPLDSVSPNHSQSDAYALIQETDIEDLVVCAGRDDWFRLDLPPLHEMDISVCVDRDAEEPSFEFFRAEYPYPVAERRVAGRTGTRPI